MNFQLPRRSALSIVCCTALVWCAIGPDLKAYAQPTASSSALLANPSQILAQNTNGGPALVSLVRNLAVDSQSALSAILGLLPNANKDQKAAIGAGLAQAAKIEIRINPSYAKDIQEAIAKTKDHELVLAFAAASGDQPTGAVGGAGGGGGAPGGGVGGQTASLSGRPAGGGSLERIGSSGVDTQRFSISSSVSGVSSVNSGSTTSTIANSVSP